MMRVLMSSYSGDVVCPCTVTGDVNFGHLFKVLSARLLHCENYFFFPLPLTNLQKELFEILHVSPSNCSLFYLCKNSWRPISFNALQPATISYPDAQSTPEFSGGDPCKVVSVSSFLEHVFASGATRGSVCPALKSTRPPRTSEGRSIGTSL